MNVIQYPIALGSYRVHPAFDADAEASGIVTVLASLLGGELAEWSVEADSRHAGEVLARLSEVAQRADDSTTVVWVGHGRSNDREAALIVPGVVSSVDDELLPSQFGMKLVAQSRRRAHLEARPWTLVVIEACGAGRFVELVNAHLQTEGDVHGVALIGVGDPQGLGHTATARGLLSKVAASFDENATVIRLNDFVTEVGERLGHGRLGQAERCRVDGFAIKRPAIVLSAPLDEYAELRGALHRLPADAQAHFAPKGLGADFGELSWLFVGRSTERQRIVTHLNQGRGLLAVTGPAGSGKSAVLGNVLLRSQPELRELLVRAGFLDDDPPTLDERELHVDVWLLLSGLSSRQAVERLTIGAGLHLDPAAREEQLVERLLAAQAGRTSPLRVIADALDESRDPDAIAQHLRNIAAAGACVVVGTRASILEGPDHPAPHAYDLLDRLGDAEWLWVRRDPRALRRYLERNLARNTREPAPPGSPISLPRSLQQRIIDAVCGPSQSPNDTAGREFLYARLLLSELTARPHLDEDTLDTLLRGNHRTIFAAALERLAAENPVIADLLEALAHAQGNGIPRVGSVWATIAGRLQGRIVGADDIDEALALGAPYIAIGAEHGQAVYRLAHRTFQEHFAEPRTTAAALAVAAGLIELADRTRSDPNPYLVGYLAGHVGRAGLPGWESLARHEMLLDVIDPDSVARELMRTALGQGPIPPALSGVLANHDALRDCAPEDRQGLRQLSTAWFTTIASTQQDPHTWSVLAATRPRRVPHLALNGHSGWVKALAPFVDGRQRVLLASAGNDRTVRVWDPATGQPIGSPLRGHIGPVWALAPFVDGRGRVLLASAGDDRTVRVWDPATGQQVRAHLHPGTVTALVAFADGHGRLLFASAGADGMVRVWHRATGQRVGAVLRGHTGWVRALVSFTDGQQRVLLASGGHDGTVRVWDPAAGQQVGAPLYAGSVTALLAFTGGQGEVLLASAAADGMVMVWDPATGQRVGAPLRGHTGWVRALVSFTDGQQRVLLASAGDDRTVRVWDPAVGQQVAGPLQGHTGLVTALVSFTDGQGQVRFATAGADGTVLVWDPAPGWRARSPLTGRIGAVRSLVSFTDRQGRVRLASAGDDRTVRVWDPATGLTASSPLSGHTDWVRALAPFTDGQGRMLLASASYDGTVRVWDPARGQPVGSPMSGHVGYVNALVSFVDGQGRVSLASAGRDGTVRVWDPARGQPVGSPMGGRHVGWVRALVSFVDGQGRVLLASASDGTVRVWDPATGRQVGALRPGHAGRVWALVSFADRHGRVLLASAGQDGTVRVWDPATGEQASAALTEHTGPVNALASFTDRQGRARLASASDDGTVRVWDPNRPYPLRTLVLATPLKSIAALPDDTLVVGLEDGWARLHLPAE